MQNMEKYFGFRVRVSDFLEPEDYEVIKEKVAYILAREPNEETQYRVYMHQMVLDAKPTQFGVSGGLSGRVKNVYLRFSINPKQRTTGDIKFMNYRFEKELHESVAHYYLPYEIGYTLQPSYFTDEREYFQNTLITLVRIGMREQHKKINIRVSVEPSAQLFEKLVRSEQADTETKINLDFKKAREFNRQTRLFLNTQEVQMSKSKPQNPDASAARTVFNVDRVGTIITDASGPISGFTNFNENPVVLDHLLHELRLLSRSIREEPPKGVGKDELAIVDVVVSEASADKGALKSLTQAGKWLGTRAEKIGLSLITEYLKQQAGL